MSFGEFGSMSSGRKTLNDLMKESKSLEDILSGNNSGDDNRVCGGGARGKTGRV